MRVSVRVRGRGLNAQMPKVSSHKSALDLEVNRNTLLEHIGIAPKGELVKRANRPERKRRQRASSQTLSVPRYTIPFIHLAHGVERVREASSLPASSLEAQTNL